VPRGGSDERRAEALKIGGSRADKALSDIGNAMSLDSASTPSPPPVTAGASEYPGAAVLETHASGPIEAGRVGAEFEGAAEATIMMVDDEPTTLEVLQVFLEEAGYRNFVPTTDSASVLERVRHETPDVLLLDLMMPDVDGLEILTRIRQDSQLAHLPVIILTSSTAPETKLAALELGATDFLGKPVDASELALRLRNTLAAKAYQDRLAYYDGVTGLPNRDLFVRRLERELRHARGARAACAVLCVSLGRLGQVNEVLGHAIGDALLGAVADRFEQRVRMEEHGAPRGDSHREAMVSRTASDEFAILLQSGTAPDEAGQLARALLADCAKGFQVGEHELFVSANIGIAVSTTDGDVASTLLRHAHAATTQARLTGRSTYQYFCQELNDRTLKRVTLENALHKALEEEQLEVHFQPQLDSRSGCIAGAEALLRWRHPDLGSVGPNEFIPIAEDTGLIIPIGAWVLRRACWQLRAWRRAGFDALSVSVNVSSHQIEGGGLESLVRAVLAETGLAGSHLVIEVTETVIMANPDVSIAVLEAIKALGVRISIDDFGTGYSTLSYLKRFPMDELKIDRSFVEGLPSERNDSAITSAVIAMAHGLGLEVVAEGIETAEQLAFLRQRRCDAWQGYLFSRPVPAAVFTGLLARQGRPGAAAAKAVGSG
jgi:diguanylate cyclase (GGDEF)-like protein